MVNLLVVLLVLLIFALLLVAGLLFLRHRRRVARKQLALPQYDEKRLSNASTLSSHRRVMVRPSESVYVYQEKQSLVENSDSPPQSPLPEIHITFPEEVDAAGKRKSGRVVVVRVGDTGVGLEPVDDTLPAYRQNEGDRFQSLDLERIGGLVEKARNAPSKE
ncbi:hypothetical protein CLAFUW4_03335 [Fulvia fulva]|uniref:Uncharacterized protein n=1 Tax=Passalora fulva TaxID=5499 RepID=A0A9Q8P5G5_PASFU|nr:uncharacterized protein CLAFUR5_03315 [Fulvia fulva]KAK4631051.1 hypothetical protein CLAFUR4_03324 [Fulvia fulva]UJO13904.1 hypothetical protein CLAFUR5_03315 [Fulvia fulva]WPV10655.1 hypothetical protein CLAFUW4_03335 [Fulvia fulva]WPV25404.1 hypothetical protein CLAFUW7_03327 [Fulvia fulva]